MVPEGLETCFQCGMLMERNNNAQHLLWHRKQQQFQDAVATALNQILENTLRR